MHPQIRHELWPWGDLLVSVPQQGLGVVGELLEADRHLGHRRPIHLRVLEPRNVKAHFSHVALRLFTVCIVHLAELLIEELEPLLLLPWQPEPRASIDGERFCHEIWLHAHDVVEDDPRSLLVRVMLWIVLVVGKGKWLSDVGKTTSNIATNQIIDLRICHDTHTGAKLRTR